MTTYRTDIWIAKAVGIVLVAYGHFGSMLSKPLWYTLSKDWVYLFHMPLFLMLSGYLFHRTLQHYPSPDIVLRSFKRLIVPYIAFVYPITILTAFLLPPGAGEVTWQTFASPLYEAQAGAANYLWFLPTLFILQAFTVILNRLSRSSAVKIGLAIAGLLYLLRMVCSGGTDVWFSLNTPVFFISYLSYYGIYFFIGLMLAERRPIKLNPKELSLLIFSFILFSVGSLYGQFPAVLSGVFKLLAGTTGSLSVWQLSRHCTPNSVGFDSLTNAGKNSDVTYLFHMFPIYLASLLASRIGFFGSCLLLGIMLALIFSQLTSTYILPKSKIARLCFGRDL